MEIEAISNVNANYGTTEVVRTTPKTTTGGNVNIEAPNPALDVPQVQPTNAGKITAEIAKLHAETELEKYILFKTDYLCLTLINICLN